MPAENTPEEPAASVLDRVPLKRKAVPLLPSLTEDKGSWNDLDEKMKRVKEMIGSTVSLKPTKLARYDQQTEMKGSPEQANDSRRGRESNTSPSSVGQLRHNILEISGVGMSISAYDVIPLDKLGMEERHTPLDIKAFLSRVGTFDLRMWSGKPDRLCAFQCARYGWRVAGKNTLLCVSCRNMLSIPHDHGCSKLEDWTSGIEQQIQKIGHMSDCIWVRSPSPINILLLPEGNDMQTYMHQAAQSFTRMRTMPVLTARYRLIMDVLEMLGFKERTGLQLTHNVEGTATELLEQCALFLMLNGWTMDDMDINALQCHLCLRQVPLWLCLSRPAISSENQDALSANSVMRKPYSNVKELDPISSHWFWCPWRKMLQRSDPEKNAHDFLQVDSTNIFDVENFAHDDIVPNLDAYMTLAVKIDADFKRGRLVRGRQSLEMADNKTAVSTIRSFKELLNALQSGSNSPNKVPVIPSEMLNEFVSINLSKAKLLCKKMFTETADTTADEPIIPQPENSPEPDEGLTMPNTVQSLDGIESKELNHISSEHSAQKENGTDYSVQENMELPVFIHSGLPPASNTVEQPNDVDDHVENIRTVEEKEDLQPETEGNGNEVVQDLAVSSIEEPAAQVENMQVIEDEEEADPFQKSENSPFQEDTYNPELPEAKEITAVADDKAVFGQLADEGTSVVSQPIGPINTTIPHNNWTDHENAEAEGVSSGMNSEMNIGPGSSDNQSVWDVPARGPEQEWDDAEESYHESTAISIEDRADVEKEVHLGERKGEDNHEQVKRDVGQDDVEETADQTRRDVGSEGENAGQGSDDAGQSEEDAGRAKEDPGQADDGPNQAEEDPGQSEEDPGQSEEDPGQAEENADQSEDDPGQAEEDQGQAGRYAEGQDVHSDYDDEEDDMYPDDDDEEGNEMYGDDDSEGSGRGESLNSSDGNHSESDDDIVCLD